MNFDDNTPAPPGDEQLSVAPESQPDASAAPDFASPSAFPPPQPVPHAREVPPDLRVPWGWTDLIFFLFLAALTMFLIQFVAIKIFAAFGVSLFQLQHSPARQGLFVFVTGVPMSLGLLGFLAIQMRIRSDGPPGRTIGWRPLPEGPFPRWMAALALIGLGVLLSVSVTFVSAQFRPKANLPIQTYFESRLSAILLMSMAVIIAPVFEETVFRGYMYPVIARSWGVTSSVIVTGTLFGLMHSMQLWGGWVQIGLLICVGLVFTYIRAVTKTVLASYLLHVSYNTTIFFGFLIASHGLRHMPSFH
ncbi:MAG TPA: type II CAAX endopeptidase family protein [Verrucomicrobiae bacterium]|nr:type II CAAX endopeptidase family protein [Verrucomicrobiae bacterium]